MPTINPYLNFNGNTEEAFNFYRSVFGGEFLALIRFRDTPEASRVPADDLDKLMHISLPIGKGNILMATDALESMGHTLNAGNHISISVDADSEEDARKLFSAISAGGTVSTPMEKMFWNALFGMCTDKFGIQWMVNYDFNQKK